MIPEPVRVSIAIPPRATGAIVAVEESREGIPHG